MQLESPLTPSCEVPSTTDNLNAPSLPTSAPELDCTPASSTPTKKPKKIDPYTVEADGTFVGDDNFRVPRNFAEFHERFPRMVRDFVRLNLHNANFAEAQDRESELTLHLMTVPEVSKFRQPGYNGRPNGCEDRIQIFNADAAFGASYGRFRNWIHRMLTNKFYTLHKRDTANPVCRRTTLSLFDPETQDGYRVDEEYLYVYASEASMSGASGVNYDAKVANGIFVAQFVEFVALHNPELIAVIEAIQMADSFVEAGRNLGLTENLFIRARNRLVYLHSCFDQGTTPIKQRRIYKPRAGSVPTQLYANTPACNTPCELLT